MSDQKVVVKYTGLGPVSLPVGSGAGQGLTIIKPGVNEFDQATWKQLTDSKRNPDIKKMLEQGKKTPDYCCQKTGMGVLVVVGSDNDSSEGEGGEGSRGTTGVPGGAADAKTLVAETYDAALLRKWGEEETRSTVLNAIEKQLKGIETERSEGGSNEKK